MKSKGGTYLKGAEGEGEIGTQQRYRDAVTSRRGHWRKTWTVQERGQSLGLGHGSGSAWRGLNKFKASVPCGIKDIFHVLEAQGRGMSWRTSKFLSRAAGWMRCLPDIKEDERRCLGRD